MLLAQRAVTLLTPVVHLLSSCAPVERRVSGRRPLMRRFSLTLIVETQGEPRAKAVLIDRHSYSVVSPSPRVR
jgi:hypothetical protein